MSQFTYGLITGLIIGWIALECWKWKVKNNDKQIDKNIKMWAYYEEPKEIDNSPWASCIKEPPMIECNMTPEQIDKVLEYMKTDEFSQYMSSLVLKDSSMSYANVRAEEGEID